MPSPRTTPTTSCRAAPVLMERKTLQNGSRQISASGIGQQIAAARPTPEEHGSPPAQHGVPESCNVPELTPRFAKPAFNGAILNVSPHAPDVRPKAQAVAAAGMTAEASSLRTAIEQFSSGLKKLGYEVSVVENSDEGRTARAKYPRDFILFPSGKQISYSDPMEHLIDTIDPADVAARLALIEKRAPAVDFVNKLHNACGMENTTVVQSRDHAQKAIAHNPLRFYAWPDSERGGVGLFNPYTKTMQSIPEDGVSRKLKEIKKQIHAMELVDAVRACGMDCILVSDHHDANQRINDAPTKPGCPISYVWLVKDDKESMGCFNAKFFGGGKKSIAYFNGKTKETQIIPASGVDREIMRIKNLNAVEQFREGLNQLGKSVSIVKNIDAVQAALENDSTQFVVCLSGDQIVYFDPVEKSTQTIKAEDVPTKVHWLDKQKNAMHFAGCVRNACGMNPILVKNHADVPQTIAQDPSKFYIWFDDGKSKEISYFNPGTKETKIIHADDLDREISQSDTLSVAQKLRNKDDRVRIRIVPAHKEAESQARKDSSWLCLWPSTSHPGKLALWDPIATSATSKAKTYAIDPNNVQNEEEQLNKIIQNYCNNRPQHAEEHA